MALVGNRWLICVLLVSFCCNFVESCGRSSVTLEQNSYRNVLIGISEEVEENHHIIERIKEIFTEASEVLAVATRNRAYFGQIKILIPKNWTYTDAEESTEEIGRSDFIVANSDQARDALGVDVAHGPFVVKVSECGDPGIVIHLTPLYILDEIVGGFYGPYGKTIVHEWAHYRWGVYDEYPVDEDSIRFYAVDGGRYEGVRCPLASPGNAINPSTDDGCVPINGTDPNCFWKDDETAVVGRPASLMYNHSLYHVFCDNDTSDESTLHNSDAPNMQNKHCPGKSVWEVMREHSDFADGANPSRTLDSTIPEFKVIKSGIKSKRTVLVLDKSGSMGEADNRIAILGQVCNDYVNNYIRDGDELGIVIFDSESYINLEMTVVSNATKQDMLDAIPTDAGGRTAIGKGLQTALSMLAGISAEEGGNIILVSDGVQLGGGPTIANVTPSIITAKVVVHTIAISLTAEPNMGNLSRETGGFTYFMDTAHPTNDVSDALREIEQRNLEESEKDIALDSNAMILRSGEVILRSTVVDSSIGRNTKFIFHYNSSIVFSISSPSGIVYNRSSSNVTCDKRFKVCTLHVEGIAEIGVWNYSISNEAGDNQRVAVTITSQASSDSSPISARAFWGERVIDMASSDKKQVLYALVSKGYSPILGANVVATVSRPSGGPVMIQLKDTGTGADVTKNDGFYSAYFVSMTGDGRYAVTVTVESTDETRVIGMNAMSTGTESQDLPTDSFRRIAAGGSFQIQNFVQGTHKPGRVNDLRVSNIEHDLQTVTLEWTAVGHELDQGQASYYELRYATNFTELNNDFSSQQNITADMILDNKTLNDPVLSGEREVFRIEMPASGNITYMFGLLVWDTNGRNVNGPLSNLISASMLFREHPAPTLFSDTTTQLPSTQTTSSAAKPVTNPNGNDSTNNSNLENKEPTIGKMKSEDKFSPVVVGIVTSGFVLISIACIVIIIVCLCQHQKKKKMNDQGRLHHRNLPPFLRLPPHARLREAPFPQIDPSFVRRV